MNSVCIGGLCELVPGANSQAIVATVDAVADGLAEFDRDVALMLDRQIGDAAAGVELVGRGKGAGRTNLEAARAVAAVIGFGLIRRKVEGGEERCEEEPRAELAADEVGVPTLPA